MPSSQLESPLHLTQNKITQQCPQRETNNIFLQITKFQPLDLWDEGSIYRYLQLGESASMILISFIALVVLGSTWRFQISYSSLGELREASVKWAASRRFSGSPLSKLLVPFVCSRSSHLTEGLSCMHRTFFMWQVRCIAPFALGSPYCPTLTSSIEVG